MALKDITINVNGGDEVENDLVSTAIHAGLDNIGFKNVCVHAFNGQADLTPQPMFTVADAVDRLRPDLFKAPITIHSRPNDHPEQPTVLDKHGTERYRENTVVTYLLEEGPFDMNHLARIDFPIEDRRQFAQLIGYSKGGYEDLSYSRPACEARAAEEARDQVERVRLHGAAPISHTEIVARDSEPPPDRHAFDVEVPAGDDGGDGDNTAP